jgi:signal transduction histidine kinase
LSVIGSAGIIPPMTLRSAENRRKGVRVSQSETEPVDAALVAAALDALPALIVILDRFGTIVWANRRWRGAALHHPDSSSELSAGANYLDVCRRAAFDGVGDAERALAGISGVLIGTSNAFRMEYRCEGLRDLWSEMFVEPLNHRNAGAIVAHWDITHYKLQRDDAPLAGRDRSRNGAPESATQVAAAFAHELKQPLAAMRANLQAMALASRAQSADRAWMQETIDDALGDLDRASQAIDAVRALYDPAALALEDIDVNVLLEHLSRSVSDIAARSSAILRLHLDHSVRRVRGDARQLRQAFTNLLTNAFDAVSESTRDRIITVRTSASGDHGAVVVHVLDRGAGIRDDVGSHIFTPFFSTKRSGTGIGLALVDAIVRAHGGSIDIRNEGDGGAIVELVLPAARRRTRAEASESSKPGTKCAGQAVAT